MNQEASDELRVRFKLVVLEYAKHVGVTTACKEFNVPRSTFYNWKQKYDHEGRAGMVRRKPVAYSHPRKTAPETVEKILDSAKGIESVRCGLRITWTATMGSRFQNPRCQEC